MIRSAPVLLSATLLLLVAVPIDVCAQRPPYDVFPPADPPYYRVRFEASKEKGELVYPVNYTIWIPQGAKSLRGVIVHQHGCGEGSCKSGLTGAYDLHWQALAKKHGCALLSPSYEQPEKADCQMWCDPRNGSDAAFQKCLVDLGAKSGHPELAKIPWALWGHSGGGHWAGGMVMLHPDRIAAAWLRSGVPLLTPDPKRTTIKAHTLPDAALKVPIMCNLGTKEGVTVKNGPFAGVWPANEAFFNEVRGKGGLVGVAIDPLSSHECGNQRYLAIPWLDACLSARLPKTSGDPLRVMPTDKAWLAPITGAEAVAAMKFAGDPLKAAWLPSETIAKSWMQYVKDTAVTDTTVPPAPTNVRLKGNELTWEAEADLESGLASFIIERDGKFLAKLPEQGKNPFGRPVFQNLQYSDTPPQPLAPMRYADTKAEAGKKHTYRVIAVNTVGLKSMPSADSVPEPAKSAKPTFDKNSPFYFDGAISRQSLENYLDRAITMGYFLVPGQPERYQFPYRDDDVRMIHNMGAKFIGRAIYRWGEESKLGDPAFLEYAKKMVDTVHSADPEVVFQGCLFEQVSADINKLKIPAWVFADFGLPVEDRTFSRAAIIKREGRPEKAGGRGGVPIINNLETRLWFYYLAVSYINVGCEALHLGQGRTHWRADDKNLKVYAEFLAKVRTYAKLHRPPPSGADGWSRAFRRHGQGRRQPPGFQFVSDAHQGGSG